MIKLKTRELIKALQDADPGGDNEVVVGGNPISFVHKYPGYFYGPYYNVIGYRFTRADDKVRIHTMDLEDVLLEDPSSKVEFDPSLGPGYLEALSRKTEEARKKMKDL